MPVIFPAEKILESKVSFLFPGGVPDSDGELGCSAFTFEAPRRLGRSSHRRLMANDDPRALTDEDTNILVASRNPTNPSSNDAQASGGSVLESMLRHTRIS